MAIRSIVTRGFGNGTFNGTIKDVVLRGYSIGEAAEVVGPMDAIIEVHKRFNADIEIHERLKAGIETHG